eukprot:FR738235.1.p1 GENE.FR738235.1~~FR738235.1.p1  ORF type:complete len:111 (+),score=4.36 FR738235.1:34-333(+)
MILLMSSAGYVADADLQGLTRLEGGETSYAAQAARTGALGGDRVAPCLADDMESSTLRHLAAYFAEDPPVLSSAPSPNGVRLLAYDSEGGRCGSNTLHR